MKAHPALFEGEGRGWRVEGGGGGEGEGQKIEEHFYQLTKQYYFTAKIMLKYCSGEY